MNGLNVREPGRTNADVSPDRADLSRQTAAQFAEVRAPAVMADPLIANDMKINYIKLGWVIPCLGIALVAGGVMAAATYLSLERQNHAAEASMATLQRLFREQQLSVALKQIHDGEVAQAAHSLDLLLCGDILLTNGELPTADPETRTLAKHMFRRIALDRPKTETEGAAPDSTREHANDQLAAERVLTMALAAPTETAAK